MYVEGTLDLLELIIMHPFLKPDDQQKEVVSMAQKAILRYFPVFEKVGGREAYGQAEPDHRELPPMPLFIHGSARRSPDGLTRGTPES